MANEMEGKCASIENVPHESERGDDDVNNGGAILTKCGPVVNLPAFIDDNYFSLLRTDGDYEACEDFEPGVENADHDNADNNYFPLLAMADVNVTVGES
jgi:hypothetical protein